MYALEVITGVLLLVVFLLAQLVRQTEHFDSGNPFFDSNRSSDDKFFLNTGDSLQYNDNPVNTISAVNNNNNLGLDSSDISRIDPNELSIQELQGMVSKPIPFPIIYSGGDVVLDNSFVAANLGFLLNKFNKDNKTEYSILNVINTRLTPDYYYFNAFLSEAKINSNMIITVAMSRDGKQIYSLTSNYSSVANGDTPYKPVSDPKNTILNSSGFFEIKNELGLFSPYPTSREEMVITQATVQAYNDKLKEIATTTGECFNIVNAINYTTSTDCTNAGGTWKTAS